MRTRRSLNSGSDPDYRFSLANERTYLAWIRTALALIGAAAVVAHLLPSGDGRMMAKISALGLACLGAYIAAYAYRRWMAVEVAMRQGTSIPYASGFLVVVLLVVGVGAAIVLYACAA